MLEHSLDCRGMLELFSSFSSKPGLDAELVRFYSANIVIALGYLRGAGVAYRNLRPENVMFTRNGYIKLIGFGIAKRIPFRGPNNHYLYKTHTLCGFTGVSECQQVALVSIRYLLRS